MLRYLYLSLWVTLVTPIHPNVSCAQPPVADWVFVPDYKLPGKAANQPGPRVEHPQGQHPLIGLEPAAILFQGQQPTQRLLNLIPPASIPRQAFTYEVWLNYHVNKPVAMLMSVRGCLADSPVPITLGFHNWESFLVMQGNENAEVQLKHRFKQWAGYKQRWVHLAVTYDGHNLKLLVNGQVVGQGHLHHEEVNWPKDPQLEIAAYMAAEPHMQLANLLHAARVHDTALTDEQIQTRFNSLKQLVEEGKLYPDLFHFNAGPYLNHATQESVALTWETDRPSKAALKWGTSEKLGQQLELSELDRLHEATISGLAANQAYFYRIEATAEDGQAINSGLLTFKTAVQVHEPFRFAVVGDTESRPHINDRLAKQIWGERPNFMINLGDLTDAGEKPHRYEWTHEYFVGMTQLISRIPVMAVPGNGESDLHWYNRYHRYPGPENYYSFEYGNAAFFMLDSNRREEEFKPGGKQYQWLDEQLSKCQARWKIVCHHHATYTGEEDDYGDAWKRPQVQYGDPFVRKIVPLYEKYGVDLAMFGHLHLYERSHPIREGKVDAEYGTVHLLAGGGGGDLEDFAPTPAFFSAKTFPGHHYVMIEIHGDKLSMRMQDLNGVIRDWLTLEKGRRTDGLQITREREKAE